MNFPSLPHSCHGCSAKALLSRDHAMGVGIGCVDKKPHHATLRCIACVRSVHSSMADRVPGWLGPSTLVRKVTTIC
jgi:hypothetical protein